MKKCQNCGAEAGDQAKFCGFCGTPFTLEGAEPAPETEAPPPDTQEPEEEMAQPPPAVQPPVAEPAAPPAYDYAQQPPVAEAPSQPMYDYPQQAQQPQIQQAPVPPTYGYPQQPQAPQSEPLYGYPPQAPMPPTPVKQKARRRWLIPVIAAAAVAALLLGTFLIFGDQIKSLFAPAEKKWLNAEKELITIDDNSIFGTARDSLNRQLDQTKFGGEMTISVAVEGNANSELAAILDIIGKLRLTASYRADTNQADPRFHTDIGLGNRESEDDALTLQVFGMDGYIFIDASPILPKPLVFQPQALLGTMGPGVDYSALVEGGPAQLINALKSMSKILSSPEKIGGDVLDIISRHAEKPVIEKGVELSVGGISQKFDRYTVVVKAENTPELMKEVLSYILDNEEIRELIVELGAISEKLNPAMPGSMYRRSFSYEDFVQSINAAIEQIDRDPANFSAELERELYLDKRGQAHGGRLIVWDVRNGKEEVLTLEHTLVEADGTCAYRFSAQPKGQNAIVFTSEYTLKDQRYTGRFELKSSGDNMEKTFLSGTMENFGLEDTDGQAYPVGKLVLDMDSGIGSIPALSAGVPMNEASITYDGKIEKGSDGPHLLADIRFAAGGEMNGISAVHVSLDLRTIPEKDVQLDFEAPDDYILLTDQQSLQALVQDDPTLILRFVQAMAELGIDISQFMPEFAIDY